MYKNISKCRVCNNQNLLNVFSLGDQVLTGRFPKSVDEEIYSGPVDLNLCSGEHSCGLLQMKQTYDGDEMYGSNYGYRSGLNESMLKHLKSKVDKIMKLNVLKDNDLILDIGSNDGSTLKFYPDNFRKIGVDPTGEKFRRYYSSNIKLICDFFSADLLKDILDEDRIKVVTSFSMFYDLPDPVAFASDINKILADDGIWIFEQSYMPTMLKTNSFDTVCHEHLEFYGLKQIQWILDKAGMKINDLEFNDVNGGSFSITASKKKSKFKQNLPLIQKTIDRENDLKLETEEPYIEFRKRIDVEKNKLFDFLSQCKKDNLLVAALGASTKGNVLLQYYNITSDLIKYVGEVNDDKFGSFTPGTKIPIIPENELLNLKPDFLVVLPWHFFNHFINMKHLKGQKLVFPLPEFKIVEIK
jgi:NDP-4-keto-2,6-dideoxyhexose 3-C-methyltransferase